MKTQVIDEGLRWVANVNQLKGIALERTEVTKAGVARLQKALLKCRIYCP